jgi:hypothetical protein
MYYTEIRVDDTEIKVASRRKFDVLISDNKIIVMPFNYETGSPKDMPSETTEVSETKKATDTIFAPTDSIEDTSDNEQGHKRTAKEYTHLGGRANYLTKTDFDEVCESKLKIKYIAQKYNVKPATIYTWRRTIKLLKRGIIPQHCSKYIINLYTKETK